jgi:hypothetical protein
MKSRLLLVLLAVACGLSTRLSADERSFWSKLFPPLPSSDRGPVACVFYVTTVTGRVECISDGKIFDLKQGDKVLARGSRVMTGDNAKIALVFSNQTTVFLSQDTEIRVDKFEQEPFTPNNNLLIEPSNSQMLIYVNVGQVVIATPQLLSGTRMVFETPHAAAFILNGQSGGEKAFLEVTPKQTHFAMIQGKSSVVVRDKDGQLASLGTVVATNQQAFVKYTLGAKDQDEKDTTLSVGSGNAGNAAAAVASSTPAAGPAPASVSRDTAGVHPALDEFVVTKVVGAAKATVRGVVTALKVGDAISIPSADIRTGANSKVSVVLSNLTTLTLGEKTEIQALKFDQEGFEPTENLDIEPSNSTSVFTVSSGLVEISTPQLLSGTSMVFESAHGAVKFLAVQSGGDEATLHVTAKQTEIQMATGRATATPRDPDGTLVSLGTTLGPGEEAVIKPTLGNTMPAGPAVALGEFRVSSVTGEVRRESAGATEVLKSGDEFDAAGSTIRTAPGARATLLFSNLSSLQVAEKSALTIDRFDQAPFAPTARLDVEPSNSQLLVSIHAGVVNFETPRLLDGSSLVFRTPQGAASLLSAESGGDQGAIGVTSKETTFQLINGKAIAKAVGPDGELVASGVTVGEGQQAVIRPVLSLASRGGALADADALTHVAVQPAPVVAADAKLDVSPAEASVLKMDGTAEIELPNQGGIAALTVGAEIPVGSVVETAAGSDVYLQPYVGAVGVIKPNSRVLVEKNDVVTNEGAIVRRVSILDCKSGTVVSVIDPAKHNINSYAVRTPKGLATAHGTSFSVTVNDNGSSSAAATADAITFTSTNGDTYTVEAGNVTFTPVGGNPQPPVSLTQAVAADPAFAGVLQAAVSTISTIVQNNIGNLAAGPATNLLSQVVGVAAAAVPAQAASYVSQAVTAVTTAGSSTAGNSAAAAAAITAAAVAALPSQGSAIAVAASQADPAQTTTIAAAAAQVSPTQASQIAAAVVQSQAQASPNSSLQTMTQNAVAVAAAIAAAAPGQAAAVAASTMQALSVANPNAGAAALTQSAAALASGVSSSVPSQATPVATALTQFLTQGNPQGNAGIASAMTAAANQGAQNPSPNASSTAGVVQATAVVVSAVTGSNTIIGGNDNGGAGGTGGGAPGGGGFANNGGNGGNGGGAGGNNGGGASQQTSVVVTQLNGGSTTSVATTTAVGAQPTSITVTQLNGGLLNEINGDLAAATTAQSSVTFNEQSGGGGPTPTPPTIDPVPTTPSNLPADNTSGSQ